MLSSTCYWHSTFCAKFCDKKGLFRWWRQYLAVKKGFWILLPHVLFPSSWGFCGLFWLPPINGGLQRLGAVESWLRNVVLKTVDIIDVAFWCENGFEIEIFENFICLKHREIFLFYLAVISYLIKRALVGTPSICGNFLIKFSINFVKNFVSQSLKSIRIFNWRKEIFYSENTRALSPINDRVRMLFMEPW